ncbi:MAG: response regulator [Burkholderiales bacterium]|nr:response regulator [Burkholderiales bacterium]
MRHSQSDAVILIAGENVDNAKVVKRQLETDFNRVFLSTASERAVQDFDEHLPKVLVLAFDSLEKAERHYLALYRSGERIHDHAHRTVALCSKDDVRAAYELCRQGIFDDYVLFWPMTHDTPRLLMAVHRSLRELDRVDPTEPTVAQFAAHARDLDQLDALLTDQLAAGAERIAVLRRLGGSSAQQPVAQSTTDVGSDQHRPDDLQPIVEWADDLKRQMAPHLASARSLSRLAREVKPAILVVDEDEFQYRLIERILTPEDYRLSFVKTGGEALRALRDAPPSLILMDVVMPGVDGIETTRRIKATRVGAQIPVIMMTGRSEGPVVIDSLKARALDFVVKPLDPITLQTKLTKALRSAVLADSDQDDA